MFKNNKRVETTDNSVIELAMEFTAVGREYKKITNTQIIVIEEYILTNNKKMDQIKW